MAYLGNGLAPLMPHPGASLADGMPTQRVLFRQNSSYNEEDILTHFLYRNVRHLIQISLKFVPNCLINQKPSLGNGGGNDSDVIMNVMVSQITRLTIVYSIVYSGAGQRKHQSSASLAFVRGIRRWPASSPHKGPVTRKMFPFDDVIMVTLVTWYSSTNIYMI